MAVPAVATSDISEMSLRDARRVALAAQGFTERRPTGRVDRRHFRRVLDRLATVQLDSVNVLTRSHELVFFARLGAYDRAALSRWLWGSHEVFEYWGHEASLHPVERAAAAAVAHGRRARVGRACASVAARTPRLVASGPGRDPRPGAGHDRRPRRPPAGAPARGELVGLGRRQAGGRAPVPHGRHHRHPPQRLHAQLPAARAVDPGRASWPRPRPTPDEARKELLLVAARRPRRRHRPRPGRLLPPQRARRRPAAGRAGRPRARWSRCRSTGWDKAAPTCTPTPSCPGAGCGPGRCCRRSTR